MSRRLPTAYDRFPAQEFDAWIGGLKDKIRKGLSYEEEEEEEPSRPDVIQRYYSWQKGKGRAVESASIDGDESEELYGESHTGPARTSLSVSLPPSSVPPGEEIDREDEDEDEDEESEVERDRSLSLLRDMVDENRDSLFDGLRPSSPIYEEDDEEEGSDDVAEIDGEGGERDPEELRPIRTPSPSPSISFPSIQIPDEGEFTPLKSSSPSKAATPTPKASPRLEAAIPPEPEMSTISPTPVSRPALLEQPEVSTSSNTVVSAPAAFGPPEMSTVSNTLVSKPASPAPLTALLAKNSPLPPTKQPPPVSAPENDSDSDIEITGHNPPRSQPSIPQRSRPRLVEAAYDDEEEEGKDYEYDEEYEDGGDGGNYAYGDAEGYEGEYGEEEEGDYEYEDEQEVVTINGAQYVTQRRARSRNYGDRGSVEEDWYGEENPYNHHLGYRELDAPAGWNDHVNYDPEADSRMSSIDPTLLSDHSVDPVEPIKPPFSPSQDQNLLENIFGSPTPPPSQLLYPLIAGDTYSSPQPQSQPPLPPPQADFEPMSHAALQSVDWSYAGLDLSRGLSYYSDEDHERLEGVAWKGFTEKDGDEVDELEDSDQEEHKPVLSTVPPPTAPSEVIELLDSSPEPEAKAETEDTVAQVLSASAASEQPPSQPDAVMDDVAPVLPEDLIFEALPQPPDDLGDMLTQPISDAVYEALFIDAFGAPEPVIAQGGDVEVTHIESPTEVPAVLETSVEAASEGGLSLPPEAGDVGSSPSASIVDTNTAHALGVIEEPEELLPISPLQGETAIDQRLGEGDLSLPTNDIVSVKQPTPIVEATKAKHETPTPAAVEIEKTSPEEHADAKDAGEILLTGSLSPTQSPVEAASPGSVAATEVIGSDKGEPPDEMSEGQILSLEDETTRTEDPRPLEESSLSLDSSIAQLPIQTDTIPSVAGNPSFDVDSAIKMEIEMETYSRSPLPPRVLSPPVEFEIPDQEMCDVEYFNLVDGQWEERGDVERFVGGRWEEEISSKQEEEELRYLPSPESLHGNDHVDQNREFRSKSTSDSLDSDPVPRFDSGPPSSSLTSKFFPYITGLPEFAGEEKSGRLPVPTLVWPNYRPITDAPVADKPNVPSSPSSPRMRVETCADAIPGQEGEREREDPITARKGEEEEEEEEEKKDVKPSMPPREQDEQEEDEQKALMMARREEEEVDDKNMLMMARKEEEEDEILMTPVLAQKEQEEEDDATKTSEMERKEEEEEEEDVKMTFPTVAFADVERDRVASSETPSQPATELGAEDSKVDDAKLRKAEKIIQDAEDPFALMGNDSTVAPGLVKLWPSESREDVLDFVDQSPSPAHSVEPTESHRPQLPPATDPTTTLKLPGDKDATEAAASEATPLTSTQKYFPSTLPAPNASVDTGKPDNPGTDAWAAVPLSELLRHLSPLSSRSSDGGGEDVLEALSLNGKEQAFGTTEPQEGSNHLSIVSELADQKAIEPPAKSSSTSNEVPPLAQSTQKLPTIKIPPLVERQRHHHHHHGKNQSRPGALIPLHLQQQASSSSRAPPTPPRRANSSHLTRSNCRFHKVNIPFPEDSDDEAVDPTAPKVSCNFIVPACALAVPELMDVTGMTDCGPATEEENENQKLDLSDVHPDFVGVVRQLVGNDILRDNDVGLLLDENAKWAFRQVSPRHHRPKRPSLNMDFRYNSWSSPSGSTLNRADTSPLPTPTRRSQLKRNFSALDTPGNHVNGLKGWSPTAAIGQDSAVDMKRSKTISFAPMPEAREPATISTLSTSSPLSSRLTDLSSLPPTPSNSQHERKQSLRKLLLPYVRPEGTIGTEKTDDGDDLVYSRNKNRPRLSKSSSSSSKAGSKRSRAAESVNGGDSSPLRKRPKSEIDRLIDLEDNIVVTNHVPR